MVRKGERVRFWTPEEEATLRKLYKNHARKEIADILGRTLPAIHRKVVQLGLRKKAKVWTEDEIKTLKKMYKSGRKRTSIARALGRPVSGVKCKASKLGLRGKVLSDIQRKGVKGEKIAVNVFSELKWKIKEKGTGASSFDFIIETNDGRTYAVNVKYGKSMLISERNLERLMNTRLPPAFLFIKKDRSAFFMPIIAKLPPLV